MKQYLVTFVADYFTLSVPTMAHTSDNAISQAKDTMKYQYGLDLDLIKHKTEWETEGSYAY